MAFRIVLFMILVRELIQIYTDEREKKEKKGKKIERKLKLGMFLTARRR